MDEALRQTKKIIKVANKLGERLLKDSYLLNTLKQRQYEFRRLLTYGHTVYNILEQEFSSSILDEACFCILTANFRADKSILIQKELAANNCFGFNVIEIEKILRKYGHRFARQRAERIVLLKDKTEFFEDIRKQAIKLNQEFDKIYKTAYQQKLSIQDDVELFQRLQSNLLETQKLRKILKKEIKGYGLKEASHFLRNIGLKNIAIIDRHIYRFLALNKLIAEKRTITTKIYQDAELLILKLALLTQIKLWDMGVQNITTNQLILTPALLDLFLFYTQTGQILK